MKRMDTTRIQRKALQLLLRKQVNQMTRCYNTSHTRTHIWKIWQLQLTRTDCGKQKETTVFLHVNVRVYERETMLEDAWKLPVKTCYGCLVECMNRVFKSQQENNELTHTWSRTASTTGNEMEFILIRWVYDTPRVSASRRLQQQTYTNCQTVQNVTSNKSDVCFRVTRQATAPDRLALWLHFILERCGTVQSSLSHLNSYVPQEILHLFVLSQSKSIWQINETGNVCPF
jgi:hypothetical protein